MQWGIRSMGRIKLITWTFVFLLAINIVSAAEISGTVRGEDGEPRPGVAVVIEGTDIGTATDYEGKFLFKNIAPGVYTLKISSFSNELKIITNTDEKVDVSFTPLVTLPPVIIEAKMPKLQPVMGLSTPIGGLYGNCLACSSRPLPIKQGDSLNIQGYESVYDIEILGESISPELMKWYIGVPKDVFGEILIRNDQWLYSDINTLLNSFELDYPELVERGVDQFNVQIGSDFPTGNYYILLKIINPYNDDPLKEVITWHQFDLYPADATDEELTAREESPQQQSSFNPNNFPTTDQPQLPGTTAYNGYWVQPLVSSWSCQETDFPATNPAYDNPAISSSCRTGEIVQRDICGCLDQDEIFTTDCLQLTHVGEYSCSNNCKNPTIKKCPEGTQCIIGRDGGACKTPNFEDLEEVSGLEYGLFHSPLELSEEEVTITLTDNDLINSALCSSLNIDVSSLEVVETQPLAGTASVIKQITGFFSRITGKQAASSVNRREYHQKITTDAYSELANIRAYISLIYFNEDGTMSAQRKARILDRKVGGALLKSYGFTKNNNIDSLIASKQRSGEHSIKESGIIIRERASLTGPSEGFVTKIAPSDYSVYAYIPEIQTSRFKDLTFILVEAREDKYFEINNEIYSVSKGLYLVPYPINEDLRYEVIKDPSEIDIELATYYEIAFEIQSRKYDVGVETAKEFGFCTTIARALSLEIVFLTPPEADYFSRDIPSTFGEGYKFPSKTFIYKPTRRTSVEYFIIPLRENYGGFKRGLYFVPIRSIISMDNEYDLRTRANEIQGIRHRPPAPNVEISYDTETLDKISALQSEKERLEGRIPCISDLQDKLGKLFSYLNSYRAEQILKA